MFYERKTLLVNLTSTHVYFYCKNDNKIEITSVYIASAVEAQNHNSTVNNSMDSSQTPGSKSRQHYFLCGLLTQLL